jgi:ArsR family transcriptional regulator, arsenate/arsenite/antimonite-responsive transcriptional repressor
MSEIYKALGDPTRRLILERLREREMSAGDLARHVKVSKPTLSGHLSILKVAGLLDVTRHGTTLIYRLNVSVLEGAILSLMTLFKVGDDEAPLKADIRSMSK